MAERVQQSKLAALGRLSASIAHEIRNPVGAMSHASQLLRESPAIGSDDRHLTDIIEKNAVRVSQIIDNVLELSRRDKTRQERLQLDAWLETLANEFRDTLQLAPERLRLTSDLPRLQVHFDPSHLHQVVWNLCDNAVKHGAGDRGDTVELRAGRVPTSGRPYLEVADRGTGHRCRRRGADLRAVLHQRRWWDGARALHLARALPDQRRDAALRAAAGRWQHLPRDLRRSAAVGMVARRVV